MRRIFFEDKGRNVHSLKVVIKRKKIKHGVYVDDYNFYKNLQKHYWQVEKKGTYIPLDAFLEAINHHERGV